MGDLERALGRNTLLIPAISIALGIYLDLKFNLQWFYAVGLLLLAAFIYISLLKFSKDPISAFKLRNYHYIWLAISFCGLGMLTSVFRSPKYIDLPVSYTNYTINGIVEDVQEKTYGDAMIVEVKRIKGVADADGMILKVNLNGDGGKIKIGDLVTITGPLKRIEDNPNSFYGGYKSLMNNKGIYYVCNIKSGDIKITRHINTLTYYSTSVRDRLEEFIEISALNKSTQNFIITLLLGDRSYLDPQLRTHFSEAGVSHVLALSGMHIGIIGGIFLFLLFPINFYGKYKLRLILTALLLWLYAFISGMAPSTIRACIMISFVTIAIISERKRYAFNALAGSILIILLYSPQTLYDVGFQLSVACVAALILFTDSLNRFPRGGNRYIYKFAEVVVATIVATFASWILTCYYFHSFPLSFLPANLIMLPILPIYLAFAILYLVLSAIGIPTGLLKFMLDKGYDGIDCVINFIGNNSAIEIWVGYDAVIFWLIGLMLLALYLNLYKWKPMLIGGISLLTLAVMCILLRDNTVKPGSFIVTDSYNSFTINVKTSNNEQSFDLPRYSNSEITIGNHKILALDSKMPSVAKISACDYLIIGGSFKGDIKKAAEAVTPTAVIIHPSVRRKRESEYIETLHQSGFKVHSLRHDKPLRVLAL